MAAPLFFAETPLVSRRIEGKRRPAAQDGFGFLRVRAAGVMQRLVLTWVLSTGVPLLAIVLIQVGVPPEFLALILGVDRLVDMTRTLPNVTSDHINDDDIVLDAVILMRVVSTVGDGKPRLTLAATPDLDWLLQIGMLRAGLEIVTTDIGRDEDDG